MDSEFKCCCGNPSCKQSLVVRKGAVFYPDPKLNHWEEGYVNVYGVEAGGLPEVMLDPAEMKQLRDWLIELYPLES